MDDSSLPAEQFTDAVPRELANVAEALGAGPVDQAGVLWRLGESGRQLDANLVRLRPEQRIDPHTDQELDVLLVILEGSGTLHTASGPQRIAQGSLLWVPHTSERGLHAGADGMAYLTVHRRRPGMRIGRRSQQAEEEREGGDAACWLHRVCPECGRLAEDATATRCPACGTDLPGE